MSKVSSLKTVGYCKDCHYWPKNQISEIRTGGIGSNDFVDCKKDVNTPIKGNWGCRWWKEDKRRKK